MGISTVVILFVALAVAIVFMGFKIVPQGFEWTVERFGRYTTTLKPGLNIIVPVVDRIGRRVNVMESVLDIPRRKPSAPTTPWCRSTPCASSRWSTPPRPPTR